MDTNAKIKAAIEEVLNEEKSRLDSLLNLCDPSSPIEKLFLISLYKKYFKDNLSSCSLDLVVEHIHPDDEQDPAIFAKANYKEESTGLYSIIKGFKVNGGNYSYEILPQYPVQTAQREFRIDFAIFGEYKPLISKEGIKKTKIAVECDGFEFHSSKEQMTYDYGRVRMLQDAGWIVLKYTGSEIYRFDSNAINRFEYSIFTSIKQGTDTIEEWIKAFNPNN